MRKFVPFVAVALFAAAPVQAQSTEKSCSISNSAGTSVSCTVSTDFTMTMPSLMNLTLIGTSVTLNAPTAVSEFDENGLVEKATTGPSFTVKSNRSYRVQISADEGTFLHTAQAGAATYNKPAGDVSYRLGTGSYVALTTTPTNIVGAGGSATALSDAAQIGYKTAFDITKDQPGKYELGVTFTLVAP